MCNRILISRQYITHAGAQCLFVANLRQAVGPHNLLGAEAAGVHLVEDRLCNRGADTAAFDHLNQGGQRRRAHARAIEPLAERVAFARHLARYPVERRLWIARRPRRLFEERHQIAALQRHHIELRQRIGADEPLPPRVR